VLASAFLSCYNRSTGHQQAKGELQVGWIEDMQAGQRKWDELVDQGPKAIREAVEKHGSMSALGKALGVRVEVISATLRRFRLGAARPRSSTIRRSRTALLPEP
jgi:hypothetical protein